MRHHDLSIDRSGEAISPNAISPSAQSPRACVWFVGGGPGAAELLTLKAARLLERADVVIFDRLISDEVLALIKPAARRLDVGKTAYGPSWSQQAINELMVREARPGLTVVRLKSGDPAVFGRLDEEMDALDAAGISFEIVPGITSASASASALKASMTRRGRNTELRLITGHDAKGFAEQDWRALARPGAVAAIYMGVRGAGFLRERLLAHGAAAHTPVAVIENASRPEQKRIAASLADLPERLEAAGITGPAILFLGLCPRDARAAALDTRELPAPQEHSVWLALQAGAA
ncbi:MAG: uroporphyrinogen-III C-methyltransferase [Neomegalonema sp.]|nr:uroporphyrinogen-III C-methyltransferase [Neomegalonema sp.]